MTTEDVEYCRGRADAVIAINTSVLVAPWASVLYAADAKWWNWKDGCPWFMGLRYSLQKPAEKWHVEVLQNTGQRGLELKPTGLRTGRESGYQAINLAVHLGAQRILLLGYDMQRGADGRYHWHQGHPKHTEPKFELSLEYYPTLIEPLKQLGVSVINCTRRTALDVFPKMTIQEALC